MSLQVPGAPDPPITGSSVPRCACQNEQPCACEFYSRRLERSQRQTETTALAAERKLAIAEECLKRVMQGAVRDVAVALAAVQAARELLP